MKVYDALLKLYMSNALKDLVTPIYHTYITTNIEVKLSERGEFSEAVNRKTKILCPVTAESVGRSSGIAPHPLYDNLSYLGNLEGYNDRFKAYTNQLEIWASDKNCPDDVKIISQYLSRGNLYCDIIKSNILDKQTNKSTPADKLVVSLVVDGITPYYANKKSASFWIEYYKNQLTPNGFCYVTGQDAFIPSSYQSKIRSDTDMAKLFISQNREALDNMPITTIGIEASQKICNTLSCLCRNYGYHINNSCFIFFSDTDRFKNPITLKECSYADDMVYFIIVSSAVTGRLAISHYQEIAPDFYNCCMDLISAAYKSNNSIEQLTSKASHNISTTKEAMLKKLLISFFTRQIIPKDFCTRLSASKNGQIDGEGQHNMMDNAHVAAMMLEINDKI